MAEQLVRTSSQLVRLVIRSVDQLTIWSANQHFRLTRLVWLMNVCNVISWTLVCGINKSKQIFFFRQHNVQGAAEDTHP
jgi:hypothetical protein